MNKQIHRLVFDRRRGMRVPAAEHVRSAGKAAGGERRATALVASGLLTTAAMVGPLALGLVGSEALAQQRTMAANVMRSTSALANMGASVNRNLPQAYTGNLHANQGAFTTSYGNKALNINQRDDKVIINWDSFNVGQGYTVRFVQPNSASSALNNIWSQDPSVILGQIQANGEVILQNQNGFIFGATARVDTGRFVVTALKLANDTYLRGIRANSSVGAATFGDDESLPTGFITIERGAEIKALAGGDVMMVAPKVYNEGTIETPKGQAILAAGQKVYLYNTTDAAQRGLLVLVDAFADSSHDVNTVEQAAATKDKLINGQVVSDSTPDNTAGLVTRINNQILAEQGTINLVGMTIRQNGVLTATTAVKGQNGAIYIQAQKNTVPNQDTRVAAELGSVEFGRESRTTVRPSSETVKDPDTGKDVAPTQKDAEVFYRSRVDVIGKDIRVRSGANITAVSGNVSLRAAANAQDAAVFDDGKVKPSGPADGSHLVVDSGATLSAAGLGDVAVPMSRNQLSGRLFATELADSPVQRGGVLYRSDILTDARRQVSVANVTGQYNLIGRTAQELSTRGGNVRLWSQGDLVIADDAHIDVSGGSIKYDAGQVMSSLVRRGNQLIALENAKPGEHYDALITPTMTVGTQQVPSYVQGADAGLAWVAGANTYMGAQVLKADVVMGPNQKTGPASSAYVSVTVGTELDPFGFLSELGVASALKVRPDLYASLRPLGGTFKVGFDSDIQNERSRSQLTQEIDLQGTRQGPSTVVIPELGTVQADQFFGALVGAPTQLVAADVQLAGVSSLLLAAQTVNMSKDASVNLGASGQLKVNAAHIKVDGQVRAAGGQVTLANYTVRDEGVDGTIEIGPNARIDLSGTRVDERGLPTSAATVNVNGGTFIVDADHSATLAQGSVVDVSAGVWRSNGGGTSTGTAGMVVLGINGTRDFQNEPTGQLFMNGQLSAFDFKSGGTLTLSRLHSLVLGGAALDEWGMSLEAGLFSNHGFGTFNLSALGDVSVVSSLTPVLRNLVLTSSRMALTPEAMTTNTVVDASNRQGMTLNLEAALPPIKGAYGSLENGGNVKVAQGVTVDVGAGGQVGLKAGSNIEVAGKLVAHGGKISLGLSGDRGDAAVLGALDPAGYIDGQEIRLTSTGVLDVSGVALTTTTATAGGDLVRGRVLGGGSVSLNVKADAPARGRVVTELKSVINVSGASADLDVGKTAGTKAHLSQGAGSVSVASADGFSLMGTLVAERPDASVSGGLFSASLSREGVPDFTASPDRPYPSADRRLTLLNSSADVAQRGMAYGEGVVSSEQLLNAGFDRIQLRADDRIVLGSGAQLASVPAPGSGQVALRSVQLTAPVLEADDAELHTVRAVYVSLGDRDLKPQAVLTAPGVPIAKSGRAGLSVQAGLIEVYGHSALQGFGGAEQGGVILDASLDAHDQLGRRQDGEIRFIGRTFSVYSDARKGDLQGSLYFGGDLTLVAGQMYASTLSNFTVQGLLGASSLTVAAPPGGSTSATPLSALAQLTLQASDVTVKGVIRQPFGSITINGENTPVFDVGSLLSVSGDGVTVPVGTTINSRQWVYATNGNTDGASPSTDFSVKVLDGLPVAKGILVKGAGLSISDQTMVQAQAGGDLQAWEFIAGVGGSTDTLNRPNVFTILPGYQYDFAPFDTEIAASTTAVGTALSAGDQVQISTGSAVLAAGRYTLLPARYATLPGAVLVSTSTLGTAGTLAQALVRDDGSVLVSGYKTAVGTAITGGNDLRQALVLEPESTFRAKSALQVSSINAALAEQAKRAGTALPSRPGDAGRVSFAADQSFEWSAQFNLAGASGFEAGQFDLSMPNMNLLAQGESAIAGTSAISVAELNATGAQSILLGGIRTGTAENAHITTLASQVTLSGAIKTSELIAVATDTVHVGEGTSVVSTGASSASAHAISVDGMGAALMVSDRVNTDLSRDLSKVSTNAPRTGALLVDAGVTLQGASVQLDGSELVRLDANIKLATDAIGVGAPHIALGGLSDDANALSITGPLLTSYGLASRLQLRSYSSIDLLGSLTLGERNTKGVPNLQTLILDTPELLGMGHANDIAELIAQNVVLRNTSGVKASGVEQGRSRLLITAEPSLKDGVTGGITVGQGAQNLAFASARLSTAADVVFSGSGMLNTQGDVTLASARVTADKTAVHGVNSQGLLTIEQAPSSRSLGEQVGAGASLSLTGQRVVQDGTIDLLSGKLIVSGKGLEGEADTVVFTERSVTQAKGWMAQAGTAWSASAAAGQIKATALSGDVVVRGVLDVSAPLPSSASDSAKSAGTITLTAAQGALRMGKQALLKGSAASATLSGKLVVDAQFMLNEALPAVAQGTLDRLINAANVGGLHGEVDVRVRQGDQSLSTTLKANRVSLSADAGKLTLLESAKIDATTPQGGVVQLASGQDLTMKAGAQVHADSSRAGANGGDVLLASTSGVVRLEDQAAITATGDDALDGRVVINMRRDVLTALANEHADQASAQPVKSASISAGEVDVVGNRVYQADTVAAAGQVPPGGQYADLLEISSHAQEFMGRQDGVLSALGLTGRANLRAGVELQSSGDFQINDSLSLADALHPGGQPLFLTIRAGKDLNFKGSLSDGFASAKRDALINPGEGASYRLVAGADTSAANVLKTLVESTGSIKIGAGQVVRTTSGSIEMAAAQDIVLDTDYATNKTAPVQGVAYVAGRVVDLPPDVTFDTPPVTAADFTSHGGRFEAKAGRDIVAPGASQLFGAWFNHVGFSNQETGQNVPVSWWTTFSAFKQGFGSFGGGNIRAEAGRDISNLGVLAPTSARVLSTSIKVESTGEMTSQHSDLVVENGGDVTVLAGRDVRGGSFFVGQGNGLVNAGGAIAIGDSIDAEKVQAVGVVLGQMNGHWSLQAVQDVNLALSFNPTMYINAARSSSTGGMYLTYGDDSTLAMSSVRGDVNWLASSRSGKGTAPASSSFLSEMGKFGPSTPGSKSEQLKGSLGYLNLSTGLVAPVVHLAAMQGNVLFDLPKDGLTLVPSALGDLSVYAGRDVSLKSTGGASLNLGDGLFTDSFSLRAPRLEKNLGTNEDRKALLTSHVTPSAGASLLHAQDSNPVRVYAGRDLVSDSGSDAGLVNLTASKPAVIEAGRDILNLAFVGQNFADTDVTRIAAGRNFVGASNPPGFNRSGGLISLSGPGELQVEAGRLMDLSTSAGIEAVGNQYNPSLSDQGASIRVAAGMARAVNVAELAEAYLAHDTAAQAKLVSHVKKTLMLGDDSLADYPGTGAADQAQVYAKALAYYQALTPQHQLALADELVTDAFVAAYLSGQGAYVAAWQAQADKAKVPTTDRTTAAFRQFKDEVVMAEIKRLGTQAIAIADSTNAAENAKRKVQRQALWDQVDQMRSLAGLGLGFSASGDIDLAGSKVYSNGRGTLTSGGIDLFAPGGQVIVGFSTLTANDKLQAASRGLVTMQGGSIRSVSDGDFQVNSQKAFVVGEGDLMVYSAHGSIDSGRGSNTDVTIPPATVSVDPGTGIVTRTVPAATTGSGIGRLNAGDVVSKGNVLLAAPRGEIRALDAFIRNESGGDIAVAGLVKGGDNIKGSVSGLAPAPTVTVSLNVGSALPTDAGGSAQAAVDNLGGKKGTDPSSILTVDLLGMGDDANASAGASSTVKLCPKDFQDPKEDCKR